LRLQGGFELFFYGGRISLLPIQGNIFYSEGIEKKFDLILKSLSFKREFKFHNRKIILEPILNQDNRFLGGKIGKESIRKLPKRPDGTLRKISEHLYPYVLFFIIEDEQVILIQRDTTVFKHELTAFNCLEDYFNRELFDLGLETSIKPLTIRGKFWDIYKDAEKVYGVKFSLKAPNYLGIHYENLSQMLKTIKDETNANDIDYGIANRSGDLQIRDKEKMQPLINWTEDGGGEWDIDAQMSGKSRRTYKNSEQLTTFEVDSEFDVTDLDQVRHIRDTFNLGSHKLNR
jgi:hypothetical protein